MVGEKPIFGSRPLNQQLLGGRFDQDDRVAILKVFSSVAPGMKGRGRGLVRNIGPPLSRSVSHAERGSPQFKNIGIAGRPLGARKRQDIGRQGRVCNRIGIILGNPVAP